ncbi:DNA-binding transcriptional regulator YhcF, GntR family [Peribacillus simplex]|uniref:DNA-binding transcriptional regulator YhcF, GntR family n=1 Tax=Peribacillus simplex TaxID=1478 RepID=A0A9X8RF92_9BACI|nr:GntR family transcriptional regulator [Peribacillus simplex]MED3912681.1 GntR family transcriptional regulator [Peribacillus simplex]SIS15254.1 DNA-binding transcriptional regulator YhcF, GntR family [Peribacillus simplex]
MRTEKPVFAQVAEMIENDILSGTYNPDDLIISTTQISKLLSVNPTTSVKAVRILTDKGVLYKKRGIGMAVTSEAKQIILNERKMELLDTIRQSVKIGISREEIIKLIMEDHYD